jgi:hypothetical protein
LPVFGQAASAADPDPDGNTVPRTLRQRKMSQIRYGSYAALRVIERIVRAHLENVGFQLLSLRQRIK